MKKTIFAVIVIASIALALSSCGKQVRDQYAETEMYALIATGEAKAYVATVGTKEILVTKIKISSRESVTYYEGSGNTFFRIKE